MTALREENVSAPDVLAAWLRQGVQRLRATGRRGIALAVLGAAVGVVIALSLPLRFTSSASFVAQGASASALPSALLGIAANRRPRYHAGLFPTVLRGPVDERSGSQIDAGAEVYGAGT